jgi:hypothetical protein
LVRWFCKYKGVLSMLFAWTHHKHKKNTWFYLQERLIWQRKSCGILSQITDKNLNRLKKIKKFLQAWSSIFFFLAEQKLAPFCGAIPLRIVLRLLIMFAPQFLWVELLLGFEQRW